MFHKRLLKEFKENKKLVVGMVFTQWIMLLCNVALIFTMAYFIESLYLNKINITNYIVLAGVCFCSFLLRGFVTTLNTKMSFQASSNVKKGLREKIFSKLMNMGNQYKESLTTSELMQISTEGVEQLEIYYGKYVPQFFYSLLAPITLFVLVSFMSFKVAIVLLLCVPMIPISIVAVQKFAKKLLSKYWGKYTKLGDTFLESIQALTTLKIYGAENQYGEKIDQEAEQFRKATMRVLTMQLNSICMMDLVAYGGAALGIILSVLELQAGNITMLQAFFIIVISAEFFLPLRLLGSFFHIAMNGNAAANKIFKLLDQEEVEDGTISDWESFDIKIQALSFFYEENVDVLKQVDFTIKKEKLTAIVGTSGCGKSTMVSLLTKELLPQKGCITIGEIDLKDITRESIREHITKVSHDSYLFAGTLEENLRMGKIDATDEELTIVLRKMELLETVEEKGGLSMEILEKGANLSGGQKQRVAMARALLKESPIYIFDEATSNIDVESENLIMNVILDLSKTKTVIMITHRLANVVKADHLVLLKDGVVLEQGTHKELVDKKGSYYQMYQIQYELEQVRTLSKEECVNEI